MKYSIIIPTLGNVPMLSRCLDSVSAHSSNCEVIVISNTQSAAASELLLSYSKAAGFQYAHLPESAGFAANVNHGLSMAKGRYLVLLNDDALVSPGWLAGLESAFKQGAGSLGLKRVGAAGPVSNCAGGMQGVAQEGYSLSCFESVAEERARAFNGRFLHTGFLSGFCMMISRECFEDAGFFDTDFGAGMWEDNDYCLKILKAGREMLISQAVFIHHDGGATFSALGGNAAGRLYAANKVLFYQKHYDDAPKKLCVVSRVCNEEKRIGSFLSAASSYADMIILVADRCTDNTVKIAKTFEKVIEIIHMDDGFDEGRDRQALMESAYQQGADWVLSLDCDEFLEKSFTRERAEQLMRPADPLILGYTFDIKTFFMGKTHFRADGVFGGMRACRLWKARPRLYPAASGHLGIHSSHSPVLPVPCFAHLPDSILHYGYESEALCRQKYDFYTKLDPAPDKTLTGPEGYRHILSDSVSLRRYDPENSVSLALIVKDEAAHLFSFLSAMHLYFDQIVVADTGSKDKTKAIAGAFGARVYDFKWGDDFSAARNFAISKCTGRWVLFLDPDEWIDSADMPVLWQMLDEDTDAWLFKVENYQPEGPPVISDNVRLFRNIPGMRYSGRVHETLTKAIEKQKFKVRAAPLVLRHYGFLKGPASKARKLKFYGRLLKRQMHEAPDDALSFFHYAYHLFEENRHEEGLAHLQRCIDLNPDFFLAYKEIGYRHLRKAAGMLSKAAEKTPQGHYHKPWLDQVVSVIYNECGIEKQA